MQPGGGGAQRRQVRTRRRSELSSTAQFALLHCRVILVVSRGTPRCRSVTGGTRWLSRAPRPLGPPASLTLADLATTSGRGRTGAGEPPGRAAGLAGLSPTRSTPTLTCRRGQARLATPLARRAVRVPGYGRRLRPTGGLPRPASTPRPAGTPTRTDTPKPTGTPRLALRHGLPTQSPRPRLRGCQAAALRPHDCAGHDAGWCAWASSPSVPASSPR